MLKLIGKRAAGRWRKPETAPKDGKPFLALITDIIPYGPFLDVIRWNAKFEEFEYEEQMRVATDRIMAWARFPDYNDVTIHL
jgi:hypothetical protein